MQSAQDELALTNKRRITWILVGAGVMPLFAIGVVVGMFLAGVALWYLLRATDREVADRRVMIGLACLIFAMNLVFTIGSFAPF